jgi:hypothetical protein
VHTYVYLKLEHQKPHNNEKPRIPDILQIGGGSPVRFKTAAFMSISHILSFYTSHTTTQSLISDLQELRLALADIEQELRDGIR